MSPPSPPAGSGPRPRSWWSRHWKWFLPTALVGGVLLFVAFVAGLFLLLTGLMRGSVPYEEGVAAARAHQEVRAVLGEPIEEGWMPSGKIEVSGGSGTASLAIPLEGPQGRGTLYVEARKRAGRWHFDEVVFMPDGSARRIPVAMPSP